MEQGLCWEANSRSSSQETPALYGIWKFITVSTWVHRRFLSWVKRVQSTKPYPIYLTLVSNITLPFTRSTLKVSSLQYSQVILCMNFSCATCTAYLILLDIITLIIFAKDHSSILWNFPVSCFFLPYRSKYFPLYPLPTLSVGVYSKKFLTQFLFFSLAQHVSSTILLSSPWQY